jgi:hypothetical protein
MGATLRGFSHVEPVAPRTHFFAQETPGARERAEAPEGT